MRILYKVKNQLYTVVILVVRNWKNMTLMLEILIFHDASNFGEFMWPLEMLHNMEHSGGGSKHLRSSSAGMKMG